MLVHHGNDEDAVGLNRVQNVERKPSHQPLAHVAPRAGFRLLQRSDPLYRALHCGQKVRADPVGSFLVVARGFQHLFQRFFMEDNLHRRSALRTFANASSEGPLGAGDIQYVANLNLAHTPRGPRLLQVEPRYRITRAERAKPQIAIFDGARWGVPAVRPVYRVSASIALADITIPSLRFVCRPDVWAFDGTESVG